MNMQGLLLDLALTLVYYMGPLLLYRFAIVRHGIPKKKARKASIISGIVMYVIMIVVYFVLGMEGAPNMAAAVIWTAVAYFIIREEDLSEPAEEEEPEGRQADQ